MQTIENDGIVQRRNEYIAVVMSGQLLKFCKENDLPFEDADELAIREDLTEFQFGYLIAYTRLWRNLID
jgi:hypothetical protein